MQSEIHAEEALRRHTLSTQPIQSLGCWQQQQSQPFKGALNAQPMAASTAPVSGISGPHPNYTMPGVRIPNFVEHNANHGCPYTFNESNVFYVNNNLLLKNSIQQHPEQVFSEIKSLQNQSNDREEMASPWRWTQDLQSFSSSTNMLAMTYTSDTRPQYPDDREQGKMPLGKSINPLARTWSEGARVSATSTRSVMDNPHLGQASNSIYSSTNLFVRFSPQTMDEEQLVKIFEPYGHILAHIITRDIHTGVNRGMGFVRYETHEQAKKAMVAINNPRKPVTRYNITLQWARRQHDNVPTYKEKWCMHKLFVRNIPRDVTHEMLEDLFRSYGELQGVSLHRDTSAAGQSTSNLMKRRIAFVTYASAGVAQEACKAIHNTYPFPSCEGIPLMIKIVGDQPTRPHKHNDCPSSPTHEWGQKRTNIVASVSNGGGTTREGNGHTAAFAIPSSGNLYCSSNNNLSTHTQNIPNVIPSGSMNSPLLNPVLPFETSDTARTSYGNTMDGSLTYGQIPIVQQMPVTNIPFTFNGLDPSFLQAIRSNNGGGGNPNGSAATLLSPDLVQPTPVAHCDLRCYSPLSSKRTGTANWFPPMAGISSSLTQAASHTGDAFCCYGGANTITEATSSLRVFPSLNDALLVGLQKASQASQNEDSRGEMKSSPISLSMSQTKNLNETCTRFGKVIEKLHNLSVANQEYSVSTTANDSEKPMTTTTEKAFCSSLGRGVGNTDVVSCKKDKGPLSGTPSSSTSSGMVCFPSYSTTDSSMVSGTSHANRCGLNTSQRVGAVSGTSDLSKWATDPSSPWVAPLLDHAGSPLALVVENPHESSEEDILDGDKQFMSMLNSIASDT